MRRLVTAGLTGANRPGRGGAGFVLLEVLVAMTVLSVGIMAVLTAVLSALDLQKDAALRHRAGLILQEKLAETALNAYDGQPRQGLSGDGAFSWSVTGERWPGAPRLVAKSMAAGQVQGQEAEEPEPVIHQVLQVIVDVSWETKRGTRRVTGSQLVHVPRTEERE